MSQYFACVDMKSTTEYTSVSQPAIWLIWLITNQIPVSPVPFSNLLKKLILILLGIDLLPRPFCLLFIHVIGPCRPWLMLCSGSCSIGFSACAWLGNLTFALVHNRRAPKLAVRFDSREICMVSMLQTSISWSYLGPYKSSSSQLFLTSPAHFIMCSIESSACDAVPPLHPDFDNHIFNSVISTPGPRAIDVSAFTRGLNSLMTGVSIGRRHSHIERQTGRLIRQEIRRFHRHLLWRNAHRGISSLHSGLSYWILVQYEYIN